MNLIELRGAGQVWLAPLALALVTAAPSPAAGQLTASQRLAIEDSGRVEPGVVEALQGSGRARVIVMLDVRSESGAPLERFRTTRARAALRRAGDSVRIAIPDDRFELAYQYRSIHSIAGEAGPEGVLALLAHPAVGEIGLDRVNRYDLAEATVVSGIKPVRRMGKHGKGVWVAVLDSGVDNGHGALRKQIKAQECFCTPGCCPDGSSRQSGAGSAQDDVGHGTLVAGAIASNGRGGAPRGAAMRASLLAMKVGNPIGPRTSDVLAALDWLLTEGPEVDIVNMSFGGGRGFKGNCDRRGASNRAYAAALDALRDLGVLSFTSSGNSGMSNRMRAPGCVKNCISVGAVYDANFGSVDWGDCVDPTSGPNGFVCFSDRSPKLDLVAPGVLIRGPALGGGSREAVGTSFSSPLAAGCAALLKRKYPDATADQLEAALESSPTLVQDPENSRQYPALDCRAAFDFLASL